MRDVGARKAIEHELAKAAADAAAAAAAKTEFLANMSHELRTPLTAILGFSELLKKSEALSVADARNAERINSASQTLLTVVNDILDFSKMEAGALELNVQPLDLVDLLQGALDLISAQAEAKGLTVRLEAEGEAMPVLGDPIRLRQVLLNLCSNALKFTDAGEIVGRVKFDAPTDGLCPIRLEICDTGIGIDESKRRLMFERFSQADGSISRQYGGTGLGLAICRQLISLMKGRIDVDSTLGRGSVFWLELALPVADSLGVSLDPTPCPMANDFTARVLVAEDHPVNQELIRLILQAAGIEVHIVGDGAQAVQAVQTRAFDLILMDIQMPVMGGPEATQRIRALEADGRRLPIVAMTANIMPEQVAAYLAAGMDAHLGKPIDAKALIATIAHWTERGRTEGLAEIKPWAPAKTRKQRS
jgi:CheY-like chemotaxis protein